MARNFHNRRPNGLMRCWPRRVTCATILVVIASGMLGMCGCSSVQKVRLRSASANEAFERFRFTSPDRMAISRRAQLTLRSYDMEKGLKSEPIETLVRIRERINREPTLDLIYSFAELAFLEANRQEERNPKLAMEMYVASALHAYGYLFDARFTNRRNSYDPHFREACLFYNGSLEKILRLMGGDRSVELHPGATYALKTLDGTFNIRCELRSGQWNGDDFLPFQFASDYEIKGLQNEYRQYGLGVPLLAMRKRESLPLPTTKYTPTGLCFPVTALLRFVPRNGVSPGQFSPHGSVYDGSMRDAFGESLPLHAVLELYDPLETRVATIAQQAVPLESDLTTPLAYTMSDPVILEMRKVGFLNPETLLKPVVALQAGEPTRNANTPSHDAIAEGNKTIKGLYMMQPFERGKIPVIFVHGLGSSPLTWIEMFNALRGEPELRNRYQFFFYYYPTGQPFWISAAQLRDDLADFRRSFDPYGADPTFNDMVLVGHSMGGLISHLQTIDGGDDFWRLAGKVPLEQALAGEPVEVREEVRKWFYFKANPSIRRVVSIATPHHGSDASNDATQWLGRAVIKIPATIRSVANTVLEQEDGAAESSLLKVKTSIDSLSPKLAIFDLIERRMLGAGEQEGICPVGAVSVSGRLPSRRSVHYHNIMGRLEQGIVSKQLFPPSDGVVKIDSARLRCAESEIIVPCNHRDTNAHPQAILEVRRILSTHLRDPSPVRMVMSGGSDGAP